MDTLSESSKNKIFEDFSTNVAGNMSLKRYLDLPVNGKSKAEYISVDGLNGLIMKSKKRTIENYPKTLSELPDWPEKACPLVPVALYKDPFAGKNDSLVLCEDINEIPIYRTAQRKECKEILLLEKVIEEKPRFEIVQNFLFEECGCPDSFSYSNARKVLEAHYQACLYVGIAINSATYSDSPGQCWSFAIGPCEGLEAADMLWISRYIMRRVSQDFNLTLRLTNLKNDSHAYFPRTQFNFSTKNTRMAGGLSHLNSAMKRLVAGHEEDIVRYKCPVASFIAYPCQIKIPAFVEKNGCGFVIDRRPAASIDPYNVITTMVCIPLMTIGNQGYNAYRYLVYLYRVQK